MLNPNQSKMKKVDFVPDGYDHRGDIKSVSMFVDEFHMASGIPYRETKPMVDMRAVELYMTYSGANFEGFWFPQMGADELQKFKIAYEYLHDPHHVRERIAKLAA